MLHCSSKTYCLLNTKEPSVGPFLYHTECKSLAGLKKRGSTCGQRRKHTDEAGGAASLVVSVSQPVYS